MKTSIHTDNRGKHVKFFTKDGIEGLNYGEIKEVFMTENNAGTLRGLHRQTGENYQQKIIKALSGKFNVRVVLPAGMAKDYNTDNAHEVIEHGPTTVLYYDDVTLDSDPIFAPKGALLGYVALEDNSRMLYLGDGPFNAQADDGFNPNSLYIDWGYEGKITMSERDSVAPKFTQEMK